MAQLDLEVVAAVWQGADVHLLARVYKVNADRNKVPIVAADIASVAWANVNAATGAGITSGTFIVADCVLAALSAGTIWTRDSKGFNFDAVLAAANLQRRVTNRIKVTLTTTAGRAGVVMFRIPAG